MARPDIGAALGVALVIITYVVGQTVAQFSSFFLEQIVVHRMLNRPSSLLMGAKPSFKPFKWIFPNYHRPLAPSTQEKVRKQAAARNCTAEDEGLFQHVYPVVTANERAQARLDDFRNLYGFARNMAFAFLVAAVSIAIAASRFAVALRKEPCRRLVDCTLGFFSSRPLPWCGRGGLHYSGRDQVENSRDIRKQFSPENPRLRASPMGRTCHPC